MEAAIREELLSQAELDSLFARSPGRRGRPKLTDALGAITDEPPWTQSALERAFLELIRAHGLPEPRCNVFVDGDLVDAHWPLHNLIVEVDGWKYHRTHRAFEEGHAKTLRLQVAGRQVARFTARQVSSSRSTSRTPSRRCSAGSVEPGGEPQAPAGR